MCPFAWASVTASLVFALCHVAVYYGYELRFASLHALRIYLCHQESFPGAGSQEQAGLTDRQHAVVYEKLCTVPHTVTTLRHLVLRLHRGWIRMCRIFR